MALAAAAPLVDRVESFALRFGSGADARFVGTLPAGTYGVTLITDTTAGAPTQSIARYALTLDPVDDAPAVVPPPGAAAAGLLGLGLLGRRRRGGPAVS